MLRFGGRQLHQLGPREDIDLGPNARKQPRLDESELNAMLRAKTQKSISGSRTGPYERWVIRTQFKDTGATAYWGTRRDGARGLTPTRTNATVYESQDTARYEGYSLKEGRRIGDFDVEQLPQKPGRYGYSHGTGGRA